MKRLIFFCLTTLVLSGGPFDAFPREAARIDVLYMNHGPLRPTLRQLEDLFAEYGDKVAVFRHDFESREGERFRAEKGIKGHLPLVIWIDGKSVLDVNGSRVSFKGFPTGSGPSFFQGKWDMKLLKAALDKVTGNH